jgi:hypothetical protein
VVIVNLGTNDVLCAAANASGPAPCRYPAFTLDDMRTDADRLVALFAPGTCVIGVAPTAAAAMGGHWSAQAAAGHLAGVADWAAETAAHPSFLADAVGHLSPEGRLAYAAFLDGEQHRLCGHGADAA